MASQRSPLERRVVGGLAWKGVSQVLLQVTRLALAVALARVLTPRDFGLAGMVLVFSAFVIPFADMGLGAAIVQRRRLTEDDLTTVFWTSVGAGTAFTLLGLAASGPVSAFYGEPAVQPLFAALSINFLLTALSATHRSLLVRDLRFRSLELRLVAGTLAGAGVALVVALRGHGPWAFVALELTIGAVSTVLLWMLSPWRPRFGYSVASLRSLAAFGGDVLGTRFLTDLTQLSDKLLIGRFVGAAPLGIYTLSYNLVLVPLTRLVGPLQEVLFPAFSQLQDEVERMRSAWVRSLRLLVALALPSMLGLIAVAPEFVQTVLGERWADAVPVVRVLAWVGLLLSLQGLNPILLQAVSRTRLLLRLSVATFAANLAAFALGLRWGIIGVAVAYAVSTTLSFPLWMWLTARTLRVSVATLAASVAGIVQASLAMLAALALAKLVLRAFDPPVALRLGVLVLTGAAVFVPLFVWRTPDAVRDLRALRPGARAGRSDRASYGSVS